MKKIWLLMIGAALILLSGCYSASSLDRKAPRRKSRPATVRKKVSRKKSADESIDPTFDAFFRRKPQKHENVNLSDDEAAYVRKQRQEDDAALRSVRGKQRLRENTKQKDWVFGTKGGSYF